MVFVLSFKENEMGLAVSSLKGKVLKNVWGILFSVHVQHEQEG